MPTALTLKSVALLLALVAVGSALREATAGAQESETKTRVVLLGTGTPNADPERSGPSLAVVVGGRAYLVDAGPGVVRRAAAAHQAGIEALEASRVATVFLTHLHSDHTAGLPDLLLTPWTLGREVPLQVVGPPGTASMVEHLREAYRVDRDIRLRGAEPANDGGHRARVVEVEAGQVYRDELVRVTAFRVPHGTVEGAFGYRFETPDRTVVISGDTGPAPEVIREQCRGCDVLVHEVYSRAGWERRDPAWRQYHASFHTSGPELGRIAAAADPELLVLTHQLLWGSTPDGLLDEIRAHFDGAVVFGRDLDVY